MTTNRINFTKKSIDALSLPPKGKRTYYYDTKSRGLTLCVTPTGTKTFYLYRKIDGRPERIRIASYPDMTIEKARGKAGDLNSEIAQGNNPQDQKRAIKAEMLFEQLFNEYIERHAKVHKKSWKGDQSQYDRYLSHWKPRKLSSIRKQDIQALHAKIGREHGQYAANRLLALLHTLFNKAIEWEWGHPNPAQGIKKFKEKSRERFLEADELPRFFSALAEEPNDTARDYILMSLLTGARQANVMAMHWNEINLTRATWTIPETKTGDPHTVPLVTPAIEILTRRKDNTSNPWVFPGTGKTGHLMEPKKAWRRILDRAGIDNLRIHDLRRSLGSWQAATGANLSIIGKTLAHKNVNTTAIYARLNIDPVRESMNKATDAILEAGGMPTKDNVVNIKK